MRNAYIKINDSFIFISSLYLWIRRTPVSSGDYAGQSSFCNALGDCWNVVNDILTHAPLWCSIPSWWLMKQSDICLTWSLRKLFMSQTVLICWSCFADSREIRAFLMLEVCSGGWQGMQTTAIRSCTVIISHVRIPLCSAERNAKLLQRLSVPYSMGKRGELLFLSYQARVSGAEGRKYQKARSQLGVSLCLCLWPLTNGISCLNWIPVSIYGLP